jgi:uridine kinase
MHQEFIAPTKKFADIIVPTSTYNPVAVNLIRNIINQKLAELI